MESHVNLISTFCRWESSLQKLLMPKASPRYSSFEECKRCDIA